VALRGTVAQDELLTIELLTSFFNPMELEKLITGHCHFGHWSLCYMLAICYLAIIYHYMQPYAAHSSMFYLPIPVRTRPLPHTRGRCRTTNVGYSKKFEGVRYEHGRGS
jgi:hypothetical protein